MDIINRFKTQRISQLIHLKNKQPGDKNPRVCNCYRLKANRSHQVTMRKKEGATRAHYGDIQTCGSVWVCPLCGSIISERRSQYTLKAIETWKGLCCENSLYLISLTTPHYIFQTLKHVLEIQDRTFKIMRNQPQRGKYKVYKTIMDALGYVGDITARDNTFGKNGWHPHRHLLVFGLKNDIETIKELRADLATAFAIAYEKAGGQIKDKWAFHHRSVIIDQIHENDNGYTRVANYLADIEGGNWDLAKEISKGSQKTAKGGNITPFGMLQAIEQGSPHAGLYSLKFWEFASTMHGKKQMWASPGLQKIVGLTEWKTDAEILEENKTGNHYVSFMDEQWEEITAMEARGQLVILSEGKNEFEFMALLDQLLEQYRECKKGA